MVLEISDDLATPMVKFGNYNLKQYFFSNLFPGLLGLNILQNTSSFFFQFTPVWSLVGRTGFTVQQLCARKNVEK